MTMKPRNPCVNVGLRLVLCVRCLSCLTRYVLWAGLDGGRLRLVPSWLIVRARPNCLVSAKISMVLSWLTSVWRLVSRVVVCWVVLATV